MKPTSLEAAVGRVLDGLGLPGRGEVLLTALSGGADSVALLDALQALARRRGFRLVAAHLDHGLREGSAADAAFCAELCARAGVPLLVERADVRARARREPGGLEQAARRERYAFLRRARRRCGAVAIAVAHTRDDQAETLLLRLLRGAGRAGLAGMSERRGEIVRPLLGVSRAQVLRHLEARGLGWREDESNADPAFTRNRVRHELLPYLERRFNPRLRQALARTAGLLADEARLLRRLTRAPLRPAPGEAELAIGELRRLPPALGRLQLRRALRAAGGLRGINHTHVERILRLAARPAPSGRRVELPGGREARVSFDRLLIGPRRAAPTAFAFPLSVPGRVALPDGLAIVAEGPSPAGAGAGAAAALEVRSRRPGDRVRIGGRWRSLKRHLIATRVPACERGRLPLVARGSDVLWTPGPALEDAAGLGLRIRLETA